MIQPTLYPEIVTKDTVPNLGGAPHPIRFLFCKAQRDAKALNNDGKAPMLNSTTPIYGFNPQNLIAFLNEGNKSIAFLDCRQKDMGLKQFKDAYHVDTSGSAKFTDTKTQYERLILWSKQNPSKYKELLKKDYVIVHCQEGAERSPALTTVYAHVFALTPAQQKNANQKIIFLSGGMRGFAAAPDSEQHLTPWKDNGEFATGPSSAKPGNVKPAQAQH